MRPQSKLSLGAVVTVAVDKPAAGGRMIGRVDGEVVFIRGAIPGERVRCRIDERRQGIAYATVVEVLEPHPDRRGNGSGAACGGNVYAHIAPTRQRTLKSEIVADALRRIARVSLDEPIPVAASPETGYRLRARFHVHDGVIGFFREGTHELCDPATTGQLLPATIETLSALSRVLRDSGSAGVRSVELMENLAGDQRVLHLSLGPGVRHPAFSGAQLAGIPGLTGLSCSVASSERVVLMGEPSVSDPVTAILATPEDPHESLEVPELGGHTAQVLRRHADAFFQGNRFLLPTLTTRVTSKVGEGPVVDLYAGVGLFACALAAAGRTGIVAIEGDRASGDDLEANASQFGGMVQVKRMAVEDYLEKAGPIDSGTVILDPPRTGMSPAASRLLITRRAARIVYVSCDPPTLARDMRRLLDAGYRLDGVEAFDFFPNTAHIETLATFVLDGS